MTTAEELELLRVTQGIEIDEDEPLAFTVDLDADLPPAGDVADILAELSRQARENGI